jgi:transcriptional antiterminator RfaH
MMVAEQLNRLEEAPVEQGSMGQPVKSADGNPRISQGWFCIRTQTKREHIAAGQLALVEGVEVFCPRIRFRRSTPRGKVWFEEALFPGYLFARFDFNPLFRAVSATVGVRGLVRFGGECAQVPAAVVELLQREATSPVVVIEEPTLKVGDEAVMTEGALIGLRAVITQVMPGCERVRVLLDLLGTAVSAEVPVSALEAA